MNTEHKNVAEVFMGVLESHGVQYIFGVPGEENLTFIEAIRKSNIKFITTRHEQAAAFMAATVGRLTGKIGVALSTLGPGATNLMTGIAYAQLGGFPLLVITGQKPIKKSKQGKFQIVDIVSMMKPITKSSETILSPDDLQIKIQTAINLAESPRKGAVHFELPEDIALLNPNPEARTSLRYGNFLARKFPEVLGSSASKPLRKVALRDLLAVKTEIQNAKYPLVILGAGCNREVLRKTLLTFFNKTNIPFVSTQMGKGAMNESSPLYIGTTSLSKGDYVHQAISEADVLIVIGHDAIEKPPFITKNENCKIININNSPTIPDPIYVPTYELIGDITESLDYFSNTIELNHEWNFVQFTKVRDALQDDIAKFASSADFPLRPERVVADIRNALPDDGMLALDNGMYKIYLARNFKTKIQNGIMLDNALATMGAGLPSGMAAKMLYPEKKVLVVAGDGGFMMSISDLETAVRLGIDLTILILDDSGFGMIRWHLKDMNLEEHGLSFGNPDFVKLAQSFGATGYKVSSADELQPTLEKALHGKGVHIVACPVSYGSANEALGNIKNNKI